MSASCAIQTCFHVKTLTNTPTTLHCRTCKLPTSTLRHLFNQPTMTFYPSSVAPQLPALALFLLNFLLVIIIIIIIKIIITIIIIIIKIIITIIIIINNINIIIIIIIIIIITIIIIIIIAVLFFQGWTGTPKSACQGCAKTPLHHFFQPQQSSLSPPKRSSPYENATIHWEDRLLAGSYDYFLHLTNTQRNTSEGGRGRTGQLNTFYASAAVYIHHEIQRSSNA